MAFSFMHPHHTHAFSWSTHKWCTHTCTCTCMSVHNYMCYASWKAFWQCVWWFVRLISCKENRNGGQFIVHCLYTDPHRLHNAAIWHPRSEISIVDSLIHHFLFSLLTLSGLLIICMLTLAFGAGQSEPCTNHSYEKIAVLVYVTMYVVRRPCAHFICVYACACTT